MLDRDTEFDDNGYDSVFTNYQSKDGIHTQNQKLSIITQFYPPDYAT